MNGPEQPEAKYAQGIGQRDIRMANPMAMASRKDGFGGRGKVDDNDQDGIDKAKQ